MSLAVFDVQVHEVRELLILMMADLNSIRRSQERIAWATTKPRGFGSAKINNVIGENGMAVSNISLTVLPATHPNETASLRVEVHLDGFETLTLPIDKAGGVALCAVPPGSAPLFEVAAVDFAGNASGKIPMVVPAIDNTAPPTPAGFGGVTVNDTELALPGFTELVPV